MNVIKRSGEEVLFAADKIKVAVTKANSATNPENQMPSSTIDTIVNAVVDKCKALNRSVGVEEIQDMVETEIMHEGAYAVAKNYITYRYERALVRKANSTDEQILSLIGRNNEEAKQENSNKNPTVNSTQRDYMAGEVSKDITRRFLLPPDIIDAHEKGIIHFHDADYFAQPMYNCCLVNLEDMLQNGTVITDTLIEKPHSFATACNIATQIIAQVASNQYGGQTITLSHLAPFVEISRRKHRENVANEVEAAGLHLSQDQINEIAEQRVRKEIKDGVQTIQYQIITLMTTNGQAPFVTVFMYLDEVEDGQTREDLAMIIEEMLKQRMKGVKNEKGVYITPAFPKLIYVLDEDNIHENSKYYYLTKLAAECTAKRMVPDYISAKIMRQLKGDVYPCMGCRSFLTADRFTDAGIGNVADAGNYHPAKHKFYGRFYQG
ncbi:MAG: anaerobic ribonucleoside-triphosphate reductase, partial [Lactimicrobium massiliense]